MENNLYNSKILNNSEINSFLIIMERTESSNLQHQDTIMIYSMLYLDSPNGPLTATGFAGLMLHQNFYPAELRRISFLSFSIMNEYLRFKANPLLFSCLDSSPSRLPRLVYIQILYSIHQEHNISYTRRKFTLCIFSVSMQYKKKECDGDSNLKSNHKRIRAKHNSAVLSS